MPSNARRLRVYSVLVAKRGKRFRDAADPIDDRTVQADTAGSVTEERIYRKAKRSGASVGFTSVFQTHDLFVPLDTGNAKNDNPSGTEGRE